MNFPRRDLVLFYAKTYCVLTFAFIFLYGLSNWLNLHRTRHYTLYLQAELNTPFIPQAILIYLSIMPLFILPIFYVDKARTVALAKAFLFTLFIACAVFMLVPTELAHARREHVTFLPWLFKLMYLIELPHNLMPSLHVAFAVLFFSVCIALEKNRAIVLAFYCWAALLVVSVLLTHQHQLIDIPTGALLGGLAYRFVYKRSLR